jgi:carbonic anhydrase
MLTLANEVFMMQKSMLRRRAWIGLIGWGLGWIAGTTLSAAESPGHADASAPSAQESLQRLLDGNARFVRGLASGEHRDPPRRKELLGGQHPFAIVLSCSDSRVPPELVFDQGLGDLFVVRVAGNVVLEDALGSVEYAEVHLHARLILVLGHERCGAVTATLDAMYRHRHEPKHVTEVAKLIQPALKEIDPQAPPAEQVRAGVEANVRQSMRQLAEIEEVAAALKAGSVRLVGAVYDMETGQVRLLPERR